MRIALPLRAAGTMTTAVQAVRCATAVAIFISGSSWRSCCRARAFTAPAYAGWIATKGSSRSKTRCASRDFGVNERIGPRWIMTSSAAASDSTTRRASWRRRSVARDWYTSSVILIVYKEDSSVSLSLSLSLSLRPSVFFLPLLLSRIYESSQSLFLCASRRTWSGASDLNKSPPAQRLKGKKRKKTK